MSNVKTPPRHGQDARRDETRLSMRAAREAQHNLATTLGNVKSSRDGLTELDASDRLQREGYNEVAHDKPPQRKPPARRLPPCVKSASQSRC